MSEWKRSDKEFPPVGKPIVVPKHPNSAGSIRFDVAVLGYTLQFSNQDWPRVATTEEIRANKQWYLEIPPLPEGGE